MQLERFRFLDHAVWFTSLPSLDAWPEQKPEGLGRFSLLLVAGATCVSDEVIERFARLAVAQDINYLCAWGPDCERVHDLFDMVVIQINEEAGHMEENVIDVLTSWHANDTLDEAIFFLLHCADTPDPPYSDSWLAVVVDNTHWAEHVRSRLAHPYGDWDDAVYEERDSAG